MAAVTMLFLPGTFVSVSMLPNHISNLRLTNESWMQALFSMVFFNTTTNENGIESLTIGRQWWLFPTITIPLTVLVFAIWVSWQRHRKRVDAQSLGIGDLTKFVEPDPMLEKNYIMVSKSLLIQSDTCQ